MLPRTCLRIHSSRMYTPLHKLLQDSANNFDSVNQLADVTISRAQNVYVYGPRNLILAYGVAGFVGLVILILGGFAYFSNGAAYDTSISSILRTAQHPDVRFTFIQAEKGSTNASRYPTLCNPQRADRCLCRKKSRRLNLRLALWEGRQLLIALDFLRFSICARDLVQGGQ